MWSGVMWEGHYTVRKDLDELELGGTVEWSPAGDASAQVLCTWWSTQGKLFPRPTGFRPEYSPRTLESLRVLVLFILHFRRIAVTTWTNKVSYVTQYLAFLATDEHAV